MHQLFETLAPMGLGIVGDISGLKYYDLTLYEA